MPNEYAPVLSRRAQADCLRLDGFRCECLRLSGSSWREEALQSDGSKIIVERTVKNKGRHEVGRQPPIGEQSLAFTLPGSLERVVWEDPFSPDIGSASFLPMLLEAKRDVAYLVVDPMGCLSYNKWGRPNPPYVIFKYQNRQWTRISLQELPVESGTPNLILSSADDKARRFRRGRGCSAQTIKKLNGVTHELRS